MGRILDSVAAVRVAVCGTLTVTRSGESLTGPGLGTRKARVLVAVLATARGGPVTSDRLAEALWGHDLPHDPQGNLATLASRLRRSVGDGFVVQSEAAYALGPHADLDLDAVADLLSAGAARLSQGEPTLCVSAANRALDLLGPEGALAVECDGDWADTIRREAWELCRTARHLLVTAVLATGEGEPAFAAATAATHSDPYDEQAHRDLMAVLVADGRPTAALDVFTALAGRLADDLGTDPDPESRALQVAILRGEQLPTSMPAESPGPPSLPSSAALVGREAEIAELDRAWATTSAGASSLMLIAGVPGIGKTRLLGEARELASRSGGLVLATRCRPGERSLFLQPYLEALRPVLLAAPEPVLRIILGSHQGAWARLLPELGEVLDVTPDPDLSYELARRRSFDAVVAALAGLAARRPVLLAVDDLQYAADVTVDLLAHLAARLGPAPVLLLGATRTEGLPLMAHLVALTEPVVLGPLPPSAVGALAMAAGFAGRADEVQARSQGHPLSVVASLRALAAGNLGVPENVATAVAGQLDRLDAEPARVALAASVLGSRVEPLVLAGLVEQPEVDVVLACERLVSTGLMITAGALYEFANDLLQEAVLAQVARPLAVAYHRRAADLLGHRPEEMAGHAHEAGELGRAAGGYLQAGRTARHMAALDDAVALLTLARADAEAAGDPALLTTVLLERARAHEARPDYAAAEQDMQAALVTVASVRDPRLEMRTLRLLGGDVAVARRTPLDDVVAHNQAGLARADELGDAVSSAWFHTRIAVLECSRLRLGRARSTAETGVRQARASGSPEALTRALDGLKAVHAYCGDAEALAPIVDELLPMLHDLHLPWLSQWALFESSLVPASVGDWTGARARVDRALEVNRETGYAAYTGFFRAQRGWLARLAGDLESAVDDGRRAVAETSPTAHSWWYATAVGTYASTLLELDRGEEAAALCRTGLTALGAEAGAAYRLRCLAPLAAATGDGLEEADRLMAAIEAPPGRAWLAGADVYDALAAAWLSAGEPARATAVLEPLLVATRSSWRALHDRATQRTSATSAAARSAPSRGTDR
jgi:DNA-binding SARP family transcriptional activator/tetratricopeptide (TPR) repeat protein